MGSLDAVNPSVWVTTTREQPRCAPLTAGASRVDVAVVGSGITGLSTSLALLERGARVTVLEAGRLCSGVTAYTTAKVTSQHGLAYAGLVKNRGREVAEAYAAANEAGLAQVASWIDEHGIDCQWERRPAVTYTLRPDRVRDIEEEVDAAQRLGLPATFTTETDLPFDVAATVSFADQAQFHPRQYAIGLAAAITARGGTIHEHTRVTDVSTGSPCTVMTEHGDLEADHVVLATHLPFLDRGGFFARAHAYRSYALAVRLADQSRAPSGMYLSADQPTRSLRTALDDGLLLVGGEGHKTGTDPDTRQRYEALESWAREVFDVQQVEHRWSAQDFMPVDGTPYVGRLLPRSRVLIATGFKKWGMTNGTAAGRILADTVEGKPNNWVAAFDTSRVWSTLTSKSTVMENLDTVGNHLVGDRLRTLRPPSVDSLDPGHGGIVEMDGHKVAAYRHEDGQLTAVSPVCRHQGCLVAWNTAEKTWDCPCHGSRYTFDGRVIEGPSTRDLEPKQVGAGATRPPAAD